MKNFIGICVSLGALGVLAACGASHDENDGQGAAGARAKAGAAGITQEGKAGSEAANGGSGPQAAFNSTFPDDESLEALGPAEATKFCEEMNAWDLAGDQAQMVAGCRLQGVVNARARLGGSDATSDLPGAGGAAAASDTDLRQTCIAGYEACIAGQIQVLQQDCKKPNFTTGSCQATVAEAEQCKNEIARLYQSSLDEALACEDVTAEKLQMSGKEPSLGAGCLAIASKCPSFLQFHFEGSAPIDG